MFIHSFLMGFLQRRGTTTSSANQFFQHIAQIRTIQIPLDKPVQIATTSSTTADGHGNQCPIRTILAEIRPKWDPDNCTVEVFTNGITNKIFCVSNLEVDEEDKLVFRVYGAGSEQLIDRNSELDTFQRLSDAGLGPEVYARFQNGLVCGYLTGECLSIQSVRQPDVVDKICHALALMHKIPFESADNPVETAIFSLKARQWLHSMPIKFTTDEMQKKFDGYFAGQDLSSQFSTLQAALSLINSPLKFCHNDLLIFNILLDEPNGKVRFIDYEYAGPNYQLFDIGNHFCEYAGVEDADYERDGPTDAERKHFLARYFFHFQGKEPNEEALDKLIAEVMHFEAVSHFFWALWAIHQAKLSQIPFDYMQYAISRHQQFARISKQFGI